MKHFKIEYEDGGEPMLLHLTDEQASEYRKDPSVAKVTAEKSSPEEAAGEEQES